mmetsp:Transcript_34429/g.78486  ORF Transcript_34429/g.78486 Transcript_34429/m.78486 type:complete len:239 (+) Transcript_34429:44-760(+)
MSVKPPPMASAPINLPTRFHSNRWNAKGVPCRVSQVVHATRTESSSNSDAGALPSKRLMVIPSNFLATAVQSAPCPTSTHEPTTAAWLVAVACMAVCSCFKSTSRTACGHAHALLQPWIVEPIAAAAETSHSSSSRLRLESKGSSAKSNSNCKASCQCWLLAHALTATLTQGAVATTFHLFILCRRDTDCCHSLALPSAVIKLQQATADTPTLCCTVSSRPSACRHLALRWQAMIATL